MAVKITNKKIPLNKLEQNNGQIDGVPANPRFISVEKFDDLKRSIRDNPEMMDLRELICVAHGDKYVVLCGNMRLRALLDLGEKDAPCKIVEGATQKQLRAYVIKDNLAFGQDDFDLLANDWNEEELREFGVDLKIDVEEFLPTPKPQTLTNQQLPQELQNYSGEAETLEKIDEEGETLNERVIIVFKREDKEKLERLLGIEITRVIYTLNEICG